MSEWAFFRGYEGFVDVLRVRLEIPPLEPICDEIDLDDVRLAGMIHSVTVV